MTDKNEQLFLLAAVVSLLGLSGIGPRDRLTWMLEVTPVLIALPVLAATYASFPLTPLVYRLIALHAVILMLGGHYPEPGKQSRMMRDYEYKRLGTLSILAALDLHDGHVIAQVHDKHRSSEFISLLKEMDAYYPAESNIRILLDNHSAHISKETMKWLAGRPGRFEFVFTPKHASWLNMVEIFFSKMARSFLRSLRVASKDELVQRLYRYINEINEAPVLFRWKYRVDEVLI